MGHFIFFDPNKFNQEAAEEMHVHRPELPDLISPEEWADCERERELSWFSQRNKDTKG